MTVLVRDLFRSGSSCLDAFLYSKLSSIQAELSAPVAFKTQMKKMEMVEEAVKLLNMPIMEVVACCECLILLFLFAWLITGSVWVFGFYNQFNSTQCQADLTLPECCSAVPYWFSFWKHYSHLCSERAIMHCVCCLFLLLCLYSWNSRCCIISCLTIRCLHLNAASEYFYNVMCHSTEPSDLIGCNLIH